jgi:translation elongation factor EF-G
MREGSGMFVVHAYLPVEASFGLADEMRRRSSGAASASLLLSHWERLQVRRGVPGGAVAAWAAAAAWLAVGWA